MELFLFLVGIVVLIVAITYLVVSLIKKDFKKKPFLIMLAIGILLPIIGLSMATQKEEPLKAVSTAKQEPKKEVLKKEEPKKEATIVELGTEQKTGEWEIKVLESKETEEINTGNRDGLIKSTDKFIIIKLELKNVSSNKAQYSNNDFMLLHSNKSKYESHMDAASKLNLDEKIYKKNNNFVGVYNDVNPGTTKNTYIVFEVPKDLSVDDFLLINGKAINTDLVAYKLK